MTYCIIVPVYNHQEAIGQVIAQLKPYGLPCYLINDGSSDPCTLVLRDIAKREKNWVTLLERTVNGGKGAAVIDGFRQAIRDGFSQALQVDADGQHCLEDISRFLAASKQHPDKMILGKPRFDESVPKARLYGRKLTNGWIWINTLSFAIKDGLCGFRCYPLAAVDRLLKKIYLGQRMDFDLDIAVRLYWQGTDAINLETAVRYPLDGVSHFKLFNDNLLISRKHAQLFFGMLPRLPFLLLRHCR
jgi:glycosyltransferase involved in cell wall biosynthesis